MFAPPPPTPQTNTLTAYYVTECATCSTEAYYVVPDTERLAWLQVFDFIMDSLDKYRTLYRKMDRLMREGVLTSSHHMAHTRQVLPSTLSARLDKHLGHLATALTARCRSLALCLGQRISLQWLNQPSMTVVNTSREF